MASVEIAYADREVLAKFTLMPPDRSVGVFSEWPEDITLHHPNGKRWEAMERLVDKRDDWLWISEKIMERY